MVYTNTACRNSLRLQKALHLLNPPIQNREVFLITIGKITRPSCWQIVSWAWSYSLSVLEWWVSDATGLDSTIYTAQFATSLIKPLLMLCVVLQMRLMKAGLLYITCLLYGALSAQAIRHRQYRQEEATSFPSSDISQTCSPLHAQLTEDVFLREPEMLKNYIKTLPKIFQAGTWVQIGANTLDPEGSSQHQIDDPLLEYLPYYTAYRKVFVEPVPFIFSALQNNTKGMHNVHLVNAAIVPSGTTSPTITMYCPTEEDFHQWLRGICSMDEQVITRIVPGKPARKVIVDALTVADLISKHSIDNIRVVMIDTEGFDVKVLKMLFELSSFRPELVVFEHTEISPAEHEEGMQLLRSHCYVLAFDRENTYGLKLVSDWPLISDFERIWLQLTIFNHGLDSWMFLSSVWL